MDQVARALTHAERLLIAEVNCVHDSVHRSVAD